MKKGFTLLELLIVITILGILATLVSGNLMNSLKRGRDAKRKEDLQQIQKAIELYYEDNKQYPTAQEVSFGSALKNPDASINKVYMQKLPKDPSDYFTYLYVVSTIKNTNDGYFLYTTLENDQDSGPGTANPNGFSNTICCLSCNTAAEKRCKFGIPSYNQDLPSPAVSSPPYSSPY
jgi:type II secretion system protein G